MLKYLFTAEFADGSTLIQTPEDRSALEPETRSQFYDVMAKQEPIVEKREKARTDEQPENETVYEEVTVGYKNPLVRFTLKEAPQTLGGLSHRRYTVDLRDGHFEVDGIPFRMHEDEIYGFELIFFRQHTHSFNQTSQNKAGGVEVRQNEVSHEIVYRMGWKLKGDQQYQRVMQIQ